MGPYSREMRSNSTFVALQAPVTVTFVPPATKPVVGLNPTSPQSEIRRSLSSSHFHDPIDFGAMNVGLDSIRVLFLLGVCILMMICQELMITRNLNGITEQLE
jgi:hypothetical protein